MHDVSTGGARLEAKHGWSVPDVFLCMPGPKLSRRCQVVWRADREVGVRFVQIPPSFAAGERPAHESE
jgi:hypothetical protein